MSSKPHIGTRGEMHADQEPLSPGRSEVAHGSAQHGRRVRHYFGYILGMKQVVAIFFSVIPILPPYVTLYKPYIDRL